jgi:hypothetical protein
LFYERRWREIRDSFIRGEGKIAAMPAADINRQIEGKEQTEQIERYEKDIIFNSGGPSDHRSGTSGGGSG